MAMICQEEDCERGPLTTGDALYRVSPKGQKFIGRCEEHLKGDPDEIVKSVVDAIQSKNC